MEKRRGMFLVVMLLTVAGCIGGGKPGRTVEKYTLEYRSPVSNAPSTGEVLKVERFSAAQAFIGPLMVYRPAPYVSDAYTYHRWRVPPADLVTDYLLRDLRSSGLFRGVFSYRDPEEARFVLEGSVQEFEEAGGQAALTLNVTLLDLAKKELPQRIVFQKAYHHRETLGQSTPSALAQGMSTAMEKISRQLIHDVAAAVQTKK